MSVLLEFAMFPTDRGESVSREVSQVINVIRESGLEYQLTPMGTIVESVDLAGALRLVEACYTQLEQLGCKRIYSSLKLDIRQGEMGRMAGKVASIQDKIGEVVNPVTK